MSRHFYNGNNFLNLSNGYIVGPWGINGENISYPQSAVTNKMMQGLGYYPYRQERVPAGQQATGWEVVLVDGEYVKRPTGLAPLPPQTTTIILPREFKKRFTIAELRAVDEIADSPDHPARDYVYSIRSEFNSAIEIDLADEVDLIPGIALLVELGVLADGRQTEILAPA